MSDQPVIARQPDDLLWPDFHPDWCVTSEADGWLGEVRAYEGRKRASVISNAARELGVRFQDIRCRVAWIRPRDRQDEWDDRGRDEAEWEWVDNHDPKLHYGDGHWRDEHGNEYECPVPARVPDDWDEGEPWASWQHAQPGEPGAVKVFICEEREG